MYNINSAYDFSAFEERKVRKQERIIKFPHKKRKKRAELRAKMALGMSFLSIFLVAASVCTFFIYGQVMLTELTEEIETVSKKLTESESIYTQLKMKKDALHSLNFTQNAKEDINKCMLSENYVKENIVPEKDVAEIK
ncbi:MAG: hypothetical protein LBR79_04425 [Oscillospiraceae bacterium]|jgi:hypothetical protein|nr:hypothetical protein [Oscillospiraceae bacterium]